jgi:hypothetical protein
MAGPQKITFGDMRESGVRGSTAPIIAAAITSRLAVMDGRMT